MFSGIGTIKVRKTNHSRGNFTLLAYNAGRANLVGHAINTLDRRMFNAYAYNALK